MHTSIDIAGVRMRHGDFVESDLSRAVDVPERNQLVVDSYERVAPGRRAIVFCVNVAHVQALAAEFAARGGAAAAVGERCRHRSTEKQITALRRRGIPVPGGLTRGQASWMITMLDRTRPRRS